MAVIIAHVAAIACGEGMLEGRKAEIFKYYGGLFKGKLMFIGWRA